MKKIAFMFAVATMFVACGGNANKAAEEAPADSTNNVTEVTDTLNQNDSLQVENDSIQNDSVQ